MPFSGGALEQPAHIMRAFDIIEGVITEIHREENAEMERKAEHERLAQELAERQGKKYG